MLLGVLEWLEWIKKIGSTFGDVKFQRTDRVLSLLTVNSTIKIHDTETAVDPLLLFQRIIVIKRTNEELRNYLEYELAPYPLSLFDEAGMRKTTKSLFMTIFKFLNLHQISKMPFMSSMEDIFCVKLCGI